MKEVSNARGIKIQFYDLFIALVHHKHRKTKTVSNHKEREPFRCIVLCLETGFKISIDNNVIYT